MDWIPEGIKAPPLTLALVAIVAMFVFLTSAIATLAMLALKIGPRLLERMRPTDAPPSPTREVAVSWVKSYEDHKAAWRKTTDEVNVLKGRQEEHGRRLVVLEEEFKDHEREASERDRELTRVVQLAETTEKRLDRMDQKLDLLLERRA